MDKVYDYAVIEITHRLNLTKPINDETVILDKVIRTGIEHKCNIAGTEQYSELQILYRDKDNKIQCGHYDIKEYRFKIIKLGDFMLDI